MADEVDASSSIAQLRRNRISVPRLAPPLLILLIYVALTLPYLDHLPRVHQDEPWLASGAWKIATEGVYGSDMFADYYKMEEHYYLNLPLFAFLTAPVYAIGGVGLWQARWTTVAMGALTLVLTYALGKRLFGATVGLGAMVLLLFTSHAAFSTYRITGILLYDAARVSRYDILVPIFLLLTLYQFDRANHAPARQPWHYFWVGVWIACATLSNLYGIFALGVVGILLVWQRVRWQAYAAVGIGVVMPLSLFVGYILIDPASFWGQVQTHGPRFGLSDWQWYWNNWQNEFLRYRAETQGQWWTRPGFAIGIIAVPLALLGLAWQTIRGSASARLVLIPALLFPLAFAWLISVKRVEYLMVIVPVWAIALAWGGVALWKWADEWRVDPYPLWMGRGIQDILAVLFAILIADGSLQYYHFFQQGDLIPPYQSFTATIRAPIPAERGVVGLHSYWFSFTDTDYRTWYTMLNLAGSEYTPAVRSIADSLNRFEPDYLVIDPNLRAYFDTPGIPQKRWAEIEQWMASHDFRLVATVEDRVYGRFDIYGR
jgi:4-amino-4-deoxy-L-arabinose transferase-like glycosyltransferase